MSLQHAPLSMAAMTVCAALAACSGNDSSLTPTGTGSTDGASGSGTNAGGTTAASSNAAVGGWSTATGGFTSGDASGTTTAASGAATGGAAETGGTSGGGKATTGGSSGTSTSTKASGGAATTAGGATAAGGVAFGGLGGTTGASSTGKATAGGASDSSVGGKASGGSSSGTGVGGATATGGVAAGGTEASTGGSVGTSAAIEDDGADCVVGSMPTSYSSSKLPNPFKKLDGSTMTTKAEWHCRRQEIVKLAEATAYGTKSTSKPTVTGTITSTKVTVNVSQGGKSASFSADVKLPSNGAKPYPAIIGFYSPMMPGYGIDESIVSSEGVAMIALDPTQIGGETGSSRSRSGAYFTVTGSNTTGTLMAWAWGISRIIDLIEQDGSILKADAIGVTGCSRYGKGAFVAGAFDQRVALGIPVESGTGGAPIWRGIGGEGAQSLGSAYGEQPWLGDSFGKNTNNPAGYFVDTHEVVALYAPRGLLILDNPHIANLGPKSAHVAALGGAEVYKALGVGDRISYHSDTSTGTHCAVRTEYAQPLRDAIERFLLKTGTAPGAIRAYSSATGKLSDWSDWTTPTLN